MPNLQNARALEGKLSHLVGRRVKRVCQVCTCLDVLVLLDSWQQEELLCVCFLELFATVVAVPSGTLSANKSTFSVDGRVLFFCC